jgi:O-antigen/teichoic acid export membrane protein
VICVFLPCMALLAAWGDELLRLWVGAEFTSSYPTLLVLTVGILAIAVQGTAGQVLLALDRHRLMAAIAGFEALCNVGLSIVLGLRFGIVGVALGTAIPALIMAFCITLPYACRLVGARMQDLLGRAVRPLAISAVAYAAMALALLAAGGFPNIVVLLVAALAVLGVTIGACLLADGQGRRTYLPMVRAALPHRLRPVV